MTLVNRARPEVLDGSQLGARGSPAPTTQAFLYRRGEASTTDYVPAAQKDRDPRGNEAAGPGERDTVTFTAPASAGRYPFFCSFPGHAQVGMRGVLIVE